MYQRLFCIKVVPDQDSKWVLFVIPQILPYAHQHVSYNGSKFISDPPSQLSLGNGGAKISVFDKASQEVTGHQVGGYFNNTLSSGPVRLIHLCDICSFRCLYYGNKEAQNVFCSLVGVMLTILCSLERRIFQNLEYLIASKAMFTTVYTLGTQKKRGFSFSNTMGQSLCRIITWRSGGAAKVNQKLTYCRFKRHDGANGDRFNSCQVIYSQFGLAIHQNDHQARRRFVEWAQNEIAVVPDFHKRILFSDEAHFWLNGYVNKQNCRIWSEANTQVYVETPLHPEKLTVWCALWAGGILLQKR
ncbi:hypothetical protein TNCV_4814361 [Trichonephila clavipes]|nr:hypothetical protein TNCV_4814361 [Trichonephila clavipes]